MALVPPSATAIMLKKKEIYGHLEEGILQFSAMKPLQPLQPLKFVPHTHTERTG
jgi:hypothetical protein